MLDEFSVDSSNYLSDTKKGLVRKIVRVTVTSDAATATTIQYR